MPRTGPRPPTDELLRKETQIVALRASGATWTEVGRALGMDRANAYKVGLRALRREHSEAVDDLRRIDGETCNRLQRLAMAQAQDGSLAAIDRVLRIMERRAKLFGLDMPTKHVVTSELDESIDQLLAQLGGAPAPAE